MKHHRPLGLAGAVIASAALLAACGNASSGSSPSSGASPQAAGSDSNAQAAASASAQGAAPGSAQGAPPPDACTVITRQDATTALGADPGPGTPKVIFAGSINSCKYTVDGVNSIDVTVSVDSRGNFDAKAATDKANWGTGYHDVSGIGDAAHLVNQNGLGEFDLYKGRVSVAINMVTTRFQLGRDIEPAVTVLGKAAAERV